MPRAEFSTKTKREAFKRSEQKCEAVGAWYGLEDGKRCNAPLSKGVEFDHIILDANSKDNSLGNCAAVCPTCHGIKTAKHDTPLAAKTKRQEDMRYVTKPKRSIASPPKPPRISTKQPVQGMSEIARRFARVR